MSDPDRPGRPSVRVRRLIGVALLLVLLTISIVLVTVLFHLPVRLALFFVLLSVVLASARLIADWMEEQRFKRELRDQEREAVRAESGVRTGIKS